MSIVRFIKRVLMPYRSMFRGIICDNIDHNWTPHAPGRHCRVCGLTWKQHLINIEMTMKKKDCVDCRHFPFCFPVIDRDIFSHQISNMFDENNPWKHDCFSNGKKNFEPNFKNKESEYDAT